MKRLLTVLAVLLPLALAAQPELKPLGPALARELPPHPYLLFTEADKPAMLERIRSERRLSELMEKTLVEGRRHLHASIQREAPRREMRTRYVGVDEHRRYLARNMDAALTLAFLYQMTGDTQYAGKAFEYANVVCAEESWVQSAHFFDVIYPRVWPYGAKDDQVVFSFDITAAGFARRLAYVYDWLYPALTKAQRDRIRGALLEKAITRVRGSYEYHWWAEAYKCNWSGICHSGLGLAALALLHEDPQLTDVVARSYDGVRHMLDHVGEDGAWQEGRGYWAYGIGESVPFIDALKRLTAGKLDLFKHRSLYPHPADFGLYGLTAAFGDGTGAPVGQSYVMNKLTQESGDSRAAWYTERYVRQGESLFDLIWPTATVKPEKPAEASRFFRSIDWAVLRKDFGTEFVTIATKAGMNDDPHHGHLDCGTFNLTWQNLSYVGEVPRTRYDEQFFSETRWSYLETSTRGHNVVTVNGEEQLIAKHKDEPWQTGIGGKITGYQSAPDWAFVAMNPTAAYPGKELKLWNRWIVLDKENNVVVVLDKVGCEVGAEINVRFHPGVEFDVQPGHVVLQGTASSAYARNLTTPEARAAAALRAGVYDAPAETSGRRKPALEMIPLFNGSAKLVRGRHAEMAVTEEPQFNWIPYVDTVIKAPARENVIATVFVPQELRQSEGAALQLKLDSSGAVPAVSYTIRGKTSRYTFAPDTVARAATQ